MPFVCVPGVRGKSLHSNKNWWLGLVNQEERRLQGNEARTEPPEVCRF
jgi:hypothetical protein